MINSIISAQQLTSTPLLTIVTITLNDQEGLEQTVRSILRQDSSCPYEHLIVDGLSSYDVAGVLATLGSSARLIAGRDAGLYDAMNKGIRAASGEYVIFLNSGDRLAANDILSNIFGVINTERPDLLYADSFEQQLDGTIFYKKSRKIQALPLGMITHHQSMVFRRKVIEKLGLLYDLNYQLASDYDFCVRFCREAETFYYLAQPLSTFLRGGASYTHRTKARFEQYHIRKTLYRSRIFAALVMAAQWALRTFRSLFPAGYWAIRKLLG